MGKGRKLRNGRRSLPGGLSEQASGRSRFGSNRFKLQAVCPNECKTERRLSRTSLILKSGFAC